MSADPHLARSAARSRVAYKVTPDRLAVLRAIASMPDSDRGLTHRLGMSPGNSTARARRVELAHLGLVEPSATRDHHTIWATTPAGRDVLRENDPAAGLTRRWIDYRRRQTDCVPCVEVLAGLVYALEAQPRLFDIEQLDDALERARALIGSRPSNSASPRLGEEQ